jgi:hypothetical protein
MMLRLPTNIALPLKNIDANIVRVMAGVPT